MPFCRECGKETTNFEDVKFGGYCFDCNRDRREKEKAEPESKEKGTAQELDSYIDWGVILKIHIFFWIITSIIMGIFMGIAGILYAFIVSFLVTFLFYIYYRFYVEP